MFKRTHIHTYVHALIHSHRYSIPLNIYTYIHTYNTDIHTKFTLFQRWIVPTGRTRTALPSFYLWTILLSNWEPPSSRSTAADAKKLPLFVVLPSYSVINHWWERICKYIHTLLWSTDLCSCLTFASSSASRAALSLGTGT